MPSGGDVSDEARLTLGVSTEEAVTVRSAAQWLGAPIRVAGAPSAAAGAEVAPEVVLDGVATVAAAEAIIRAHQRRAGATARERTR